MESKRQRIIKHLQNGLSASQTADVIKDATIEYVYKVRSDYMRSNAFTPKINTYKKTQIQALNRRNIRAKSIAVQVGCSIQYVYKVLKNKPKAKLLHDKICNTNDNYYTPLYAILPLTEYIEAGSVIWCPFDTAESLYVRYFTSIGHRVVHSHIDNGEDFFKLDVPKGVNYIISNPPYSQKDVILQKLISLGVPFAMLVNLTGLFAAKSRFSMLQNKIELMLFNSRIQYMDSLSASKTRTHPPFESGYVCSGILPEKLVFAELNKTHITL